MDNFHKIYGGESAEIYLNEISDHTIIFGHKSVGNNILSGISYWEEQTGVKLNRKTTRDFSNLEEAAFIDFSVGANGDTHSKIDDFVAIVESIPYENSAVAFFKLCYVDVVADSDVDELFEYYKEKMLYLKQNYGNTHIVLLTVPLTNIQAGLKALVKKILGRELVGISENIKRHQINERILTELSADFLVFDLAAVESTLPNGEVNLYERDGNEYPAMSEAYTYDGGHLNDLGSNIVAYNLLAILAEAVK